MNKTMQTIVGAGVIIALFYAGFYIFNAYIYNEKQSAGTPLQEGEHFGFITTFTDNETRLEFDSATWLSGEAGEDAAIRAGFCTEATREECLPNGYFIENESRDTISIPVAENAQVFLMTWNMEETGQVTKQPVSLDTFTGLINNSDLHWNQLPYTITVSEDAVVQIEEVYIP